MTSTCDIEFNKVTHVIIDTGYCPSLSKMLSIEWTIRNECEANVTCLFGYDSNWHIGVLTPNRFGFADPDPDQLVFPDIKFADKYIEVVNNEIDRLMSKRQTHPFYEQAKQNLIRLQESHAEIASWQKDPRLDLYRDTLEMVQEWACEPLDDDADDDADDDDESKMSYDERLRETQRIVDLFGGVDKVDGFLCFKINNERRCDLTKWIEMINKNGLDYCAVFDLEGMTYKLRDDLKVLVLKYDAEHG